MKFRDRHEEFEKRAVAEFMANPGLMEEETAMPMKSGRSAKMKPPTNVFEDEDFKDQLVKLLVASPKACQSCSAVLSDKDFKPLQGEHWGPARRVVAGRALAHYQEHGRPLRKLLRSKVIENVNETELGKCGIDELNSYLDHLGTVKPQREAVLEMVLTYKQQRRMATAIEEMAALQAAGDLTPEKLTELSYSAILPDSRASKPVSAASILEQEFTDPAYVVNPFVPDGQVGCIAGRPKVGKSWLILQLAASTASGWPFLKRKVERPGRVLYFALEDTERRLNDRLRQLLTTEAEQGGLGAIDIHFEAVSPAQLRQLLEEARREKDPYRMVIIDPFLGATKPRRTNVDLVASDYQQVAVLGKIAREQKVALVVVHHTRKASADYLLDTLLGTTGTSAAFDWIWILQRRQADTFLQITGRDVRERELRLRLRLAGEKRGWRPIAEGPEATAGNSQIQVLALLRKKKRSLSRKQMSEETGFSLNRLDQILHRLWKRGKIRKIKGGLYAYPQD